jgi:hypothetical protein
MKKGVRSINQRYGCGDPDPDPHQNVTDPQHAVSSNVANLDLVGCEAFGLPYLVLDRTFV